MADKYYRLVSFLVNICPQPLRELFLKYMNADPNRPLNCNTLGGYLASRKPQLQVLRKRKVIRQDQWQLLFPPGGQVDESSWDTTLLILLIDEFFKMQLTKIEEDAIQDIRGIRNRMQHMAETSIADTDFDGLWNLLESAALDLANQIQPSPTYANTIKVYIDDTKINNMPKLGDTLRYWYEDIIFKLKSDMEDMKELLKEVSENTAVTVKETNECRKILKESSVQKVGSSGEKVKRMKTVDHILANLNHNFVTTLKENLPPNFISPPEVSDIKTNLRDVHHVVVTGHRSSLYLETALAAIRDLGLDQSRCVQMRDSSDWRHIDPDEVDMALCIEPFGNFSFDEKRTKGMVDIFNSMLRTARPTDGSKHIDIVIVSEKDLLREAIPISHEHDILECVVQVYKPTSASTPADLTGPGANTKPNEEVKTCTQNVLDFTAVFMESHRDDTLQSKEVMTQAKDMFKKKKMLVLTGPRKCGKTSLALSLASVYKPDQFMLINRPEDIKLISLGYICVILVKDFAGKYSYIKDKASTWFEEFDMLHTIVSAGKLNVIITCQETLLQKSREDFGSHPLLENILTLEHVEMTVKEESASVEDRNVKDKTQMDVAEITNDAQTLANNPSTAENWNTRSGAFQTEKRTRNSSDVFFIVEDICTFRNDEFLLLNTSARVSHLNSDLEIVGTYETCEASVEKICQIDDRKFLIVSGEHLSVYELNPESVDRLQTIEKEHDCDCIAVENDEDLSILDGNTIYQYTSELQLIRRMQLPIKHYKDNGETKKILLINKKCVVILRQHSLKSVVYSTRKHFKRCLYFENETINPVCICTSEDDIFLLCSYKQSHAKIMRYKFNLEKVGVLDLAGVEYMPSLTSMIFHKKSSKLLVASGGNLDEWVWDEPTGIHVQNGIRNVDTAKFTRVKKIDEIEIDFPHPMQPEEYIDFCQHPDGSFIIIGRYFDVNTNALSMMMYHVQSNFQYISHYDISNICTPNDLFPSINICCTDSGDVVITYDDMVSIYKITDGTIHIIKSTEISEDVINISFHRKRIYCLCCYNQLYMLDTNLNVKKKVKFSFNSMDIEHVVPCLMQKYFYIGLNDEDANIICDDPKQKQIRYLGKEGFEPMRFCAASDDSVFVLGGQDSETGRILLLNTDMEILSDISLDTTDITWSLYGISKLEFDKANARLIVLYAHSRSIQIYLE